VTSSCQLRGLVRELAAPFRKYPAVRASLTTDDDGQRTAAGKERVRNQSNHSTVISGRQCDIIGRAKRNFHPSELARGVARGWIESARLESRPPFSFRLFTGQRGKNRLQIAERQAPRQPVTSPAPLSRSPSSRNSLNPPPKDHSPLPSTPAATRAPTCPRSNCRMSSGHRARSGHIQYRGCGSSG